MTRVRKDPVQNRQLGEGLRTVAPPCSVWVTPEAIAAWAPAATGRRGRPRTAGRGGGRGLMLRLAFVGVGRGVRRSYVIDSSDSARPELRCFGSYNLSRRGANLGIATALKRRINRPRGDGAAGLKR